MGIRDRHLDRLALLGRVGEVLLFTDLGGIYGALHAAQPDPDLLVFAAIPDERQGQADGLPQHRVRGPLRPGTRQHDHRLRHGPDHQVYGVVLYQIN